MIESQLYTTTELAELLGEPRRKIQIWAGQRRIPGSVRMGHQWKFRKTDIDKALASENFLLAPLETKPS